MFDAIDSLDTIRFRGRRKMAGMLNPREAMKKGISFMPEVIILRIMNCWSQSIALFPFRVNEFIRSGSREMLNHNRRIGNGQSTGNAGRAAGIQPMVCMNPILLKPTNHTGSQVIVTVKCSEI